MEIIKHEGTGEREGRDGRIRTGKCTEWFVVKDGDLISTFRTRREAKVFIAGGQSRAEGKSAKS